MSVPVACREIVGRAVLRRNLKTPDRATAERLKWPTIAEFKDRIAKAEAALSATDPIEREALIIRARLDAIPESEHGRDPKDDSLTALLEAADGPEESLKWEALYAAEDIERTHGRDKAVTFYKTAVGERTPLEAHVGDFLSTQGYKPKSEADFKRALGYLKDWLTSSGQLATVEAVGRRNASDFVHNSLEAGRSAKKAQAYLSFIRSYWEFMQRTGRLTDDGNIWRSVTISKAARQRPKRGAVEGADEVRPFEDEEVAALLSGDWRKRPEAGLCMYVAALSGMRIEEICRLRLRDCGGGIFKVSEVRRGKTEAARRSFPIHPDLAQAIAQRVRRGRPDDYLIDGLRESTASSEERSSPLSKWFTRYRRKVGVGGGAGDFSPVNFHSFRRWFIRKARDGKFRDGAGFDEFSIEWVVGHDGKGSVRPAELSQKGYAGPDPMDIKRRVVEAVQLPAGILPFKETGPKGEA
ncbi:MAG: hypothetical protein Q8K28_09530 [Hoeflea sp.]|nr:tyrosine-type recombinase/integrase [Hoeflea sp.]MDP2120131.1 hypothetical protein [Hoeflea sp.]